MKLRSRTTIAVTAAALAVAAGTGGALAAAGSGGSPKDGSPGLHIGVGHGGGPAAVAAYLGLTQDELRAQLEGGKTLAQVAAAQSKSVDGLKAAILAGAKQELDQAVAAGQLTAAQEQQMLSMLQEHLDDIVNNAGPVSVN